VRPDGQPVSFRVDGAFHLAIYIKVLAAREFPFDHNRRADEGRLTAGGLRRVCRFHERDLLGAIWEELNSSPVFEDLGLPSLWYRTRLSGVKRHPGSLGSGGGAAGTLAFRDGGFSKVEHVLERGGVEVAGRKVRSLLIILVQTQKTLLDECKQRRVVGHPMMWPRERGDGDEGNTKAELIEVRARGWVHPCRGELWADAGGVKLAHEALRAGAGLLARWWV